MKPAEWGVAVEKGEKVYLHITNPKAVKNQIELKNFPYELKKASRFESGKKIKFSVDKNANEIKLQIPELNLEAIDQVVVLDVKK
jgi:hypothetical protein